MISNIKQVIVIRKDLNMRKGKIASQAAHASMAIFLNQSNIDKDTLKINLGSFGEHQDSVEKWIQGSFTKIVVSVNSESELLDVFLKATEKNLPCSLIKDSGRTEFNNVPTHTSVAIGPCEASFLEGITTDLKLL